jgi:hypothetical protein
MVPGGGGDWLQPGGELANPYFGNQMLRCGETVSEFPARGTFQPEPQNSSGRSDVVETNDR